MLRPPFLRKSLVRLLIAGLFLFGAAFGIAPGTAAAPAGADPTDITCLGSSSTTWSPGLTLEEASQTVTSDTLYGPCESLSENDLTSGSSHTTVTSTFSCLAPLESGFRTHTITWNTGQTSTLGLNRTVTNLAGNTVVTDRGLVTAGLFQGATAVRVLTFPTLNALDCLHPPGITSVTGAVTLTITMV